MEEPKKNSLKANVCLARNERNEKIIAICNAATIAALKAIKEFRLNLDDVAIKEIKSDAVYAALTHVNPEAVGALSYANKCGRTSVLMALRKKKNSTGKKSISCDISRIDAMNMAEETQADFFLLLREKEEEEIRKESYLRQSVERLSEADKGLLELYLRDLRYSEIAKELNCSEATARKRTFELRKRIRRSMEQQGFNAA